MSAPQAAKPTRPSRFIEAAKKGQHLLIQQYKEDPTKNIDVNKVDGLKQTALHWAARGGHGETVKMLLSYNANPNLQDNMGETPLHKAAYANYPHVITLLLEGGADRDIPKIDGRTPSQVTENRDCLRALAPPEVIDEPDRGFEQDDSDSD